MRAILCLLLVLVATPALATSYAVQGAECAFTGSVTAGDSVKIGTAAAGYVSCVDGGLAASSTSKPSNPTAPASTSAYKMQGLAGSITPGKSGNVLITICATVTNSSGTAGDGILFQISEGTGGAPSNAGNLAGTQLGQPAEYENSAALTAADIAVTICPTALVTGLTLGTAYWIDLAAKSVGTISVTALTNVNVVAIELP